MGARNRTVATPLQVPAGAPAPTCIPPKSRHWILGSSNPFKKKNVFWTAQSSASYELKKKLINKGFDAKDVSPSSPHSNPPPDDATGSGAGPDGEKRRRIEFPRRTPWSSHPNRSALWRSSVVVVVVVQYKITFYYDFINVDRADVTVLLYASLSRA